MRVMVLGSTGLVGSAFKRICVPAVQFAFEDHATLDITRRRQVQERLNACAPAVVINTAACVGILPCSRHPQRAFAVNALGPRTLARLCRDQGIVLVQISTSAVFDGRRGLYSEADAPNPINLYGMTKYLGELFVANLCPQYYVVRLPMLFGRRENRGATFLEKMQELVLAGQTPLRVADDEINSPSYSDDLAQAVIDLVRTRRSYGVYHLKNEGVASLYEFAAAFFEKMAQPVEIQRTKAEEFVQAGCDPKPADTSLRSVRIPHLRPWQEAIADYVAQLRSR